MLAISLHLCLFACLRLAVKRVRKRKENWNPFDTHRESVSSITKLSNEATGWFRIFDEDGSTEPLQVYRMQFWNCFSSIFFLSFVIASFSSFYFFFSLYLELHIVHRSFAILSVNCEIAHFDLMKCVDSHRKWSFGFSFSLFFFSVMRCRQFVVDIVLGKPFFAH